MENASKALLIAGGILLAILTISIFFFSFRNASYMAESMQDDSTQKELLAFNTSFEAYNKKLMYGSDVISVFNQAIDSNRKFKIEYGEAYSTTNRDNMDYYVDVECRFYRRNGTDVDKTMPKEIWKLSQNYTQPVNDIRTLLLDEIGKKEAEESDFCHSFKYAGFKCIKVEYVRNARPINKTALGRVNLMVFEEV